MSVENQMQLYGKSHDDFNSAGNDEFPPSLWGSVFKLLTDKGGKPHVDPLVFEFAGQDKIRYLDGKYGPDEPVPPGYKIAGFYNPHEGTIGKIYLDDEFREIFENPQFDDPVLKGNYELTVNHEKAHQMEEILIRLGIMPRPTHEESENFADDYASRGKEALSKYGDVEFLSGILLKYGIKPELESLDAGKLKKYNHKNYGGMFN